MAEKQIKLEVERGEPLSVTVFIDGHRDCYHTYNEHPPKRDPQARRHFADLLLSVTVD